MATVEIDKGGIAYRSLLNLHYREDIIEVINEFGSKPIDHAAFTA